MTKEILPLVQDEPLAAFLDPVNGHLLNSPINAFARLVTLAGFEVVAEGLYHQPADSLVEWPGPSAETTLHSLRQALRARMLCLCRLSTPTMRGTCLDAARCSFVPGLTQTQCNFVRTLQCDAHRAAGETVCPLCDQPGGVLHSLWFCESRSIAMLLQEPPLASTWPEIFRRYALVTLADAMSAEDIAVGQRYMSSVLIERRQHQLALEADIRSAMRTFDELQDGDRDVDFAHPDLDVVLPDLEADEVVLISDIDDDTCNDGDRGIGASVADHSLRSGLDDNSAARVACGGTSAKRPRSVRDDAVPSYGINLLAAELDDDELEVRIARDERAARCFCADNNGASSSTGNPLGGSVGPMAELDADELQVRAARDERASTRFRTGNSGASSSTDNPPVGRDRGSGSLQPADAGVGHDALDDLRDQTGTAPFRALESSSALPLEGMLEQLEYIQSPARASEQHRPPFPSGRRPAGVPPKRRKWRDEDVPPHIALHSDGFRRFYQCAICGCSSSIQSRSQFLYKHLACTGASLEHPRSRHFLRKASLQRFAELVPNSHQVLDYNWYQSVGQLPSNIIQPIPGQQLQCLGCRGTAVQSNRKRFLKAHVKCLSRAILWTDHGFSIDLATFAA
eukprot:2501801-Amphidinium_carterae.1